MAFDFSFYACAVIFQQKNMFQLLYQMIRLMSDLQDLTCLDGFPVWMGRSVGETEMV